MTIYKWFAGLVLCLFVGGAAFGQADGTLDTTFNSGRSFPMGYYPSLAYTIALQRDGKILVTDALFGIIRLNTKGSIDSNFTSNVTQLPLNISTTNISAIQFQPDDKIICGGGLRRSNGNYPVGKLIRLNSNGIPDSIFNQASGILTGSDSSIYCIALQPDGKILVGGGFTRCNGKVANCIARFNSDGTMDTTFQSGGGFDGKVRDIVIQPDNKIIVGGEFWYFNHLFQTSLVRLNSDGSRDTTFKKDETFNGMVDRLTIQPDGKIICGGFSFYFTTSTDYPGPIVRFNPNGSLDTTFKVYNLPLQEVWFGSHALQADGKILIGGDIVFNNGAQEGLIRIHSNGKQDSTFHSLVVGAQSSRLLLQPNGEIIYSSGFPGGLVRLNNNSSINSNKYELRPDAFLTPSPNPAHLSVTITSAQPVKFLLLIDTTGQRVLTQPGTSATLDVSLLPPGLYLLEAEMETGSPVRRRLVVE